MKGFTVAVVAAAVLGTGATRTSGQEVVRRPLLDEDGRRVTRYGLWLAEDGDYLWADDVAVMESRAMVRTPEGGWRPPTIDDALREIRRPDPDRSRDPTRLAFAILEQELEERSSLELDAFAERLVDIAITEGGEVTENALAVFSNEDVYPGAFGRVLRYHDATADRVPSDQPVWTLLHLYSLDRHGQGREMLRAALAKTVPPPSGTYWEGGRLWCMYVGFLKRGAPEAGESGSQERRAAEQEHLERELQDLPGDVETYARECGWGRSAAIPND